jgi:UDP-N-acetylmuramate--alanine ligase
MKLALRTDELHGRLKSLSPIHFVGVGGSGMLPLAEFTATFNCAVTGSDLRPTVNPSSFRFALEGSAQAARFLSEANSIVYSSAISSSHPAMQEARTAGKKILHRSELLALFTENFKTVAVTGTHGKSTTSAMVSHVLQTSGMTPSWIIGAPFANGQAAFCRGTSDLLVIEADESDGSFLKYTPFVSIINNIELDHLDFYKTFDRVEAAFSAFISRTSSAGGVVYPFEDETARRIAGQWAGKVSCFGKSELAAFQLLNSSSQGLWSVVEFLYAKRGIGFSLPMPGHHNILNALAAIAACSLVGVDPVKSGAALESFPGVARRLQRYTSPDGRMIFDDYAHNPGKINSCLLGLRGAFPERRLIAVFQPHRFTRISSLYDQFVMAFSVPNTFVVVLPVYAAGEPSQTGFEPEKIARDIADTAAVQTFAAQTLKEASDLVESIIDRNLDLVVTLGAGDVWRVAENLAHGSQPSLLAPT